MIKGSDKRKADHSINPLFVDRWSPRSMTGEALTEADLLPLFEAARWAPSSMNLQPWRFLYALRGDPHWDLYMSLLADMNRGWAQQAGALVVVVSNNWNEVRDMPSPTHSLDTGAAWQNFALQAWQMGLAVHGVGGFDRVRARTELQIPEKFSPEMMIVAGRPGAADLLPEPLKARETPSDRRPVAQSVAQGLFAF